MQSDLQKILRTFLQDTEANEPALRQLESELETLRDQVLFLVAPANEQHDPQHPSYDSVEILNVLAEFFRSLTRFQYMTPLLTPDEAQTCLRATWSHYFPSGYDFNAINDCKENQWNVILGILLMVQYSHCFLKSSFETNPAFTDMKAQLHMLMEYLNDIIERSVVRLFESSEKTSHWLLINDGILLVIALSSLAKLCSWTGSFIDTIDFAFAIFFKNVRDLVQQPFLNDEVRSFLKLAGLESLTGLFLSSGIYSHNAVRLWENLNTETQTEFVKSMYQLLSHSSSSLEDLEMNALIMDNTLTTLASPGIFQRVLMMPRLLLKLQYVCFGFLELSSPEHDKNGIPDLKQYSKFVRVQAASLQFLLQLILTFVDPSDLNGAIRADLESAMLLKQLLLNQKQKVSEDHDSAEENVFSLTLHHFFFRACYRKSISQSKNSKHQDIGRLLVYLADTAVNRYRTQLPSSIQSLIE